MEPFVIKVVMLVPLLFSCIDSAMVVNQRCSYGGIYNFGDSNSDTGGISAAFEPITTPYGMTFFKKPVGRVTDGRLVYDFLGIIIIIIFHHHFFYFYLFNYFRIFVDKIPLHMFFFCEKCDDYIMLNFSCSKRNLGCISYDTHSAFEKYSNKNKKLENVFKSTFFKKI